MPPILLTAPIIPTPGESRRDAERRTVATMLSAHFGHAIDICHDPIGSPYIPDYDGHISISHCRDMAVAALDSHPVGIDVETWRDQLIRVAPRFLTPRERQWAGTDPERLLRAWTAKEAIYKLLHTPGLPLSHILLHTFADGSWGGATVFYKGAVKDIAISSPNSSPHRVITIARYI